MKGSDCRVEADLAFFGACVLGVRVCVCVGSACVCVCVCACGVEELYADVTLWCARFTWCMRLILGFFFPIWSVSRCSLISCVRVYVCALGVCVGECVHVYVVVFCVCVCVCVYWECVQVRVYACMWLYLVRACVCVCFGSVCVCVCMHVRV